MILALQTAGAETRFWLAPPDRLRADTAPTLKWESGRSLADELLGKITTLLRQLDLELADLTGVIIFSGPGSFTSLRIGHAVANALADGLGIPVVGAAGDDWLAKGAQALRSAPVGRPAVPVYGSEPNITRPGPRKS
jgi:tRNA threonylcarbamoyladenosine biosynthesis protein TsaB